MEDLYHQFIARAEAAGAAGGEEWIRACLQLPAMSSTVAPVPSGSASGDAHDGRFFSSEALQSGTEESAPISSRRRRVDRDAADTVPRKRCRKTKHLSPPATVRHLPPTAHKKKEKVSASQPPLHELPALTPQQLEPISSSSAAGETLTVANFLPTSVPPAIDSNVLSQFLSHMCQFFSAAKPAPVSMCGPAAVWAGNTEGAATSSLGSLPAINANIPAMWAGGDGVTATGSVSNVSAGPSVERNLGVAESCFKEALTCEVSPLGYHLSLVVKEKIWKNEFVDILSLIPSTSTSFKDSPKVDKKSEEKEEERKRFAPKSFYNWTQGFCIFASILGEKKPHLCSGLFRHLEIILEAHRNFGGNAWFIYDEMFRQKMSVHPAVKWGSKDVGLWLNLMLPQRSLGLRPNAQQHLFRKGVCFAFNDSSCKFGSNCRYRHDCSFCSGAHSAIKCFKKANQQGASKESVPKGGDSSELVKANSLVRGLPRSGES